MELSALMKGEKKEPNLQVICLSTPVNCLQLNLDFSDFGIGISNHEVIN